VLSEALRDVEHIRVSRFVLHAQACHASLIASLGLSGLQMRENLSGNRPYQMCCYRLLFTVFLLACVIPLSFLLMGCFAAFFGVWIGTLCGLSPIWLLCMAMCDDVDNVVKAACWFPWCVRSILD